MEAKRRRRVVSALIKFYGLTRKGGSGMKPETVRAKCLMDALVRLTPPRKEAIAQLKDMGEY